MSLAGAACPCTDAATITVEWQCPRGHRSYAALCQMHGQVHVASLLSGGVMCGTCRREDGREVAVALKRVNGKAVSSRLSRAVL